MQPSSPAKVPASFADSGAPCRPAFSLRHLAFVLCWVVLASGPAAAREKKPAPPTRAAVAEKQTNLKELRGQIESLRKEVSAAESRRASEADQLKNLERGISGTQRELHALSSQRSRLQERLGELGQQSRELESRLGSLHSQLENLVYRRYVQGKPDALHLLLNGEDPNQMARDLYYLSIIGQSRSQLAHDTAALLERKKSVEESIRERASDLAAVEARQKEQHGKLLEQRAQRQAMLEKISARIAVQRKEIGNLQRDEKQLTQLIDRLNRTIAAQQAAAKKRARQTQPSGKPSTGKAPQVVNENTPVPVAAGQFAALKGSLRLPVRGVIANRFGSARPEGSAWKGLFIRAAEGSEIKAIANGRVVFADWMRGFGNLLIVDHGGNYLSIYGNNDALLKQEGDSVRGGDSVATAGNSGGNPESGLYFELRHRGQPIDPMQWVSLK